MNAGTDYAKAKRQAQANANSSGQLMQMWLYNGVWWIERLGLSERGCHTSRVPDAEVIEPSTDR